MNGWDSKRLNEVFEIKPPKSVPRKKFSSETLVSFLPMEDLGVRDREVRPIKEKRLAEVTSSSYTFFTEKDVLLAKITPCFENGKLGIAKNLINGVGFGSSEYMVFRSTGVILPEYLFYFLSNEQFRDDAARTMSGAVGHKRLSKEFVENYFIPYPVSLPEQQRIVALLDEAFAAIAKAKANTEKNLLNARELFESYLEEVFEDGGKKWKVVKVRDVSKVIGGFSFKSKEFVHQGKYQVLRMGNVRPGIIREEESPVFIDSLDEAALKKSLLKRNDVIITQTGTKNKRDYGFTAIVDKDNYLLNQRIASVRFNKDYLPKFFLYFSWTKIFKDQFFANETGTVGQGNVGIGAITEALIPECSTGEQKLLVEQLEFIENQTKKLEAHYRQKLTSLEELKKSILQKAFRGELSEKEIVV